MSAKRLSNCRILITGGAGFLGVHAARELAAQGAHLLLQDTSHKRADMLQPVLRSGRTTFVVCGLDALEQAPALLAELPRVDYLVHLALSVPRTAGSMGPDTAVTAPTVLEAWRQANLAPFERLLAHLPSDLKGICLASTLAVYAPSGAHPVCETSTLQPLTALASTKLAMEASLASYARRSGVPGTVLRFSTLYGPGETHARRLIPSFIRSLLAGQPPVVRGDGNDWWDYLYVRDAARAVRLALEHLVEAPGVYNVGSGHGWTARAVAHALQRQMGLALPPRHVPGGLAPLGLIADIARARGRLRFCPETALADGLRAELAYHRAQAAGGGARRRAVPGWPIADGAGR